VVAPVCTERLGFKRGQNAHSVMQSNTATTTDSIPGRMAIRSLALPLGEPTPQAAPWRVSPRPAPKAFSTRFGTPA
jgi:hypothetical protein